MGVYHMRRKDREFSDPQEINDILRQQKIVTIALSYNNEPYLFTIDYVFDIMENCIFFHCAKEGKKIVYMDNNPIIWGQVLEDLGYIVGECSHAYRTVQFKGKITFLENYEAKKNALEKMIRRFESNPEPLLEKFIQSKSLDNVKIGKISLLEVYGKKNLI
jgi:hypothetical protein